MTEWAEPVVDEEAVRVAEFRTALLTATPRTFATEALIAANVVVYVVMVARGVSPISPSPETLITWGADYGPLTTHGQWWRIVTNLFVHVGLLHLLMNMYVLLRVGRFAERLFGNLGFLVLYGLGGIGGSCASLALHPSTVSAGASGAVFAVYGGLLGYLVVQRRALPLSLLFALRDSTLGFVAFNILFGLTTPNVDVAAHIGGFLSGIPIGGALAVPPAIAARTRLVRSALVATIGTMSCAALLRAVPVVDDWPREMAAWAALEKATLTRFDSTTDELRARKLTQAEYADRVEHEIVAPLEAERAKMLALRGPATQRVIASRMAGYVALRVDALRLNAEAERTGDRELFRKTALKHEEALSALQAIVPSPALTARIAELKTNRVRGEALEAELDRFRLVHQGCVTSFNAGLAEFRAQKQTDAEFAGVIERQVLPPWIAERQRLSTLLPAPSQRAYVTRLVAYMDRRAEAWRLMAAGLRGHDVALMQKGLAVQMAADELLRDQPSRRER